LFLMKNSIPLFVLDEEQHPIVCSCYFSNFLHLGQIVFPICHLLS
jgi:hypothetical protein